MAGPTGTYATLPLLLLLLLLAPEGHASAADRKAASRQGGYGGDLYTAASGGYSSYSDCDCSKYDLLGVLAGGAALAALGIFLLLQQAAAGRALTSPLLPPLPPLLADALRLALPQHDLAGSAVGLTCRVSHAMDTDRRESRSLAGTARSGYGHEDGFCDCFLGLIGALAGFAALAAVAAFALQQAAAAAAGGRSSSAYHALPDSNDVIRRFAGRYLKALADNDDPCLPHTVCQISQDASSLSPRLYTVVRLASMPISWFLSSFRSSLHTFSDYCEAISDVTRCDVMFPQCARGAGHVNDDI